MNYLLRFLLLILAVVCIIGARRVSRAQTGRPEQVKSDNPVAQLR